MRFAIRRGLSAEGIMLSAEGMRIYLYMDAFINRRTGFVRV